MARTRSIAPPVASTRILVVDDDAEVRDILNKVLTQAGYEVRLATNGREALEQVRSHPPQLIILDLSMPEMNGFEVMSALRVNPEWAKIPVVVVTAMAGHSAAHLGVRGTLTKPFNIVDVQAAVRLALRTPKEPSSAG